MSVFDPIDVRVGNERRKNTLQRLMQQVMARGGQRGGRTAGGYGGRTSFNRPARNRVTQRFDLPPGLAAALGPGGFTRPDFGVNASAAPGQALGRAAPPAPLPPPPPPAPLPPPRDGAGGQTYDPSLPTYDPDAAVASGVVPLSPGFDDPMAFLNRIQPPPAQVLPAFDGAYYDPNSETFLNRGRIL